MPSASRVLSLALLPNARGDTARNVRARPEAYGPRSPARPDRVPGALSVLGARPQPPGLLLLHHRRLPLPRRPRPPALTHHKQTRLPIPSPDLRSRPWSPWRTPQAARFRSAAVPLTGSRQVRSASVSEPDPANSSPYVLSTFHIGTHSEWADEGDFGNNVEGVCTCRRPSSNHVFPRHPAITSPRLSRAEGSSGVPTGEHACRGRHRRPQIRQMSAMLTRAIRLTRVANGTSTS